MEKLKFIYFFFVMIQIVISVESRDLHFSPNKKLLNIGIL